jgi:ubiquinone/menaquinone biosynthesis C-methylase UbiE
MKSTKAYKGMPMEGLVAKWYAGVTRDERRHRSTAERFAAEIPPGSRVLEIAPGPGYFSIALAKLGKYQISGLDISKSFVEMARKNAEQSGVHVDFQEGSASDMPFADEAFDFTFCQAAFKNFAQPVKAIAEMYRVLRPGGRSVILDLRRDASRAEINRHIETMGLNPVNRWITKWTFQNFLLKNAYTISEMEGFIAQTPFNDYRFEPDDIGFTLWLVK